MDRPLDDTGREHRLVISIRAYCPDCGENYWPDRKYDEKVLYDDYAMQTLTRTLEEIDANHGHYAQQIMREVF